LLLESAIRFSSKIFWQSFSPSCINQFKKSG
jgi:hypothetical protein